MTQPDDRRKRSPADRFRNILSAENDQEPPVEPRKPPVVNLPKTGTPGGPAAREASSPAPVDSSWSAAPNRRFLPTFWTIACIVSLALNTILLILVLSLMHGLGTFGAGGTNAGLLTGLYNNFQQMDEAHIKTTIPVEASFPLDASIPVQASTKITLARDVAIEGAHVKINTALFNIDAPASLTLPAGTSLDVMMDFALPVHSTVPISLQLPVDIALQDTELHRAILGLQETIKPLLCATSPTAITLQGAPICP
jgi:hypothetical protein